MRTTDVFTPTSTPSVTYIHRSGEKRDFEDELRNALLIPGMVISVAGPSKSGKSVLVNKVVGADLIIPVSGARIRIAEDIWEHVLAWMDVPYETQSGERHESKIGASISAHGSASVLGLAKGGVEGKGQLESGRSTEDKTVFRRGGLTQVVRELGGSDFVILIDDFHYMAPAIQVEVARQIKDAAERKVKIIAATVLHRADEALRANPELRGRLQCIDIPYWQQSDLVRIGEIGFGTLNAIVSPGILAELAQESAGSPQLMQLICLHVCFFNKLMAQCAESMNIEFSLEERRQVFEQASATADFRSLFDVMDCGPKQRGKERKIYRFKDGSSGDVYRSVLKAVAADPPVLSHNYESLLHRVADVCDGEAPTGSSISGSCHHMVNLAHEAFPNDRAIDWDKDRELLDIPDPYLLFYLRWSGRLLEKAE